MVAPLLLAGGAMVAGGAAGSLFGKKKAKPIDITSQLNQVRDSYMKQNQLNQGLTNSLTPLTASYKDDLAKALGTAKTDFTGSKAEYLGQTDANTKEAQDAMRANLYSDTFRGVPDSLQAIREASAAGGGLKTGSYQKAVGDFGSELASKLATGERDVQLAGVQNRQSAQENAFNTFNNLSSKLTDAQITGLTKVMDTGREDMIRQYTTSMGLGQEETQAIIDLLNFQASGNLAKDTAADSDKQSLYNALIGGGGALLGKGGK